MYMTELEAIEWARAHPHIEPEPDAPRPNDLLEGEDQAVTDDIMEGYNFDLDDFGPDDNQVDDNLYSDRAEVAEAQPAHEDDDVDMIGEFAPELDIDQLRAEAQNASHTNSNITDSNATVKPSGDAPPQPLRCVSANVQKSNENTHMLLETNKDADIICVQEIFWGLVLCGPGLKPKSLQSPALGSPAEPGPRWRLERAQGPA